MTDKADEVRNSDDVKKLWLAHVARTRRWADARRDAAQATLVDHVTEQLRRQPSVAPQLRAEIRQAEGDYWGFLWAILGPDRRLAWTDPDSFRTHVEVGFTAEQMPIRVSAALPRVTTFPSAKRESKLAKYTRTWFGGRPLGADEAQWPRAADGTPLAHVVQVGLRDEYEELPRAVGLPKRGILQIFHDLTTYGNPEDAEENAWSVRWLDVGSGKKLTVVERPDDLPEEARIDPVPARISPMATIPSNLDFNEAEPEPYARYERIALWLEQYPYDRNAFMAPDLCGDGSPWEEDPWLPEPVSRLGGYGYNEYNSDYDDALREALPLGADDEYVMLADINPAQFTDADWFHGQRHLQVWIRSSDLARRNFDDCWCFIRTDG